MVLNLNGLLDSLGLGLLEPHGAIKITIIRIRKFAENIVIAYLRDQYLLS